MRDASEPRDRGNDHGSPCIMASPESNASLSISLAGELPCSDLPAQGFIVITVTSAPFTTVRASPRHRRTS